MTTFAGILISFLYGTAAWGADFTSLCGQFGENKTGGYCIHVPQKSTSKDVLYYLHGRGNSEHTWAEEWFFPAQLRAEWAKQGTNPPIVVTVSFGPKWVLAEKNSSRFSGLFETFKTAVMPMIEAQMTGLSGRRMIMGDSMGGFNSVQLALKTNLFSRAAILCAPMTEVSPFAPRSEIDAYVKRSRAYHYYGDDKDHTVMTAVGEALELVHAFFPTPAEWATANPLALAAAADWKVAPKFYVTVGFYDRFASYEANEAFVARLQARGLDVEWHPQWGGHCVMDIASLSRFLTTAGPELSRVTNENH